VTQPVLASRPGSNPGEPAPGFRDAAVAALFNIGAAGPLLLPQPPPGAASLVQAAVEDETLHAAAIGNSAHLRLQTASGQDLSLHIRVRDGIADIRVDGSAGSGGVPAIELRASEVRTALAGEGLSLGTFESPTSVPAVAGRDLAATGRDGPASRPLLPDGGARLSHAAQSPAVPWSAPASAAGSERKSGDTGASTSAAATNNNNNNNNSASSNGYGYGGGSHSRSPADPGPDRDGRTPRSPAPPTSSAPASTTSASPQPDPRVNRRVHITA